MSYTVASGVQTFIVGNPVLDGQIPADATVSPSSMAHTHTQGKEAHSVTYPIPKRTAGGTAGSYTLTDGKLTAYTVPT